MTQPARREDLPTHLTHEMTGRDGKVWCHWCGKSRDDIAATSAQCLQVEYPDLRGVMTEKGFYRVIDTASTKDT